MDTQIKSDSSNTFKKWIKRNFPFVKKVRQFIKREDKFHFTLAYLSFLNASLILGFYKITKKQIVAICQVEHIGDIIANEPIAREAKKQHPNATIIWFARKQYRELLKYNPAINKTITVHCLTSWIWIKQRHKFEALYELHFNGRVCPTCLIPLTKEDFNYEINGSNYYNFGGLLKAVFLHNKVQIIDDEPKLYIPQKAVKSLASKVTIRKYIAIHCKSNETIRDWDNIKWIQLIGQLILKYNIPVIEVGLKSYLNLSKPLFYNYCGKLELLETAELIKNAVLFCGIDSAPAHMANAVGAPGVILLGEYFYGMKNYNPYSGNYGKLTHCRIIQSADTVKSITVSEVMSNVESLLLELTVKL